MTRQVNAQLCYIVGILQKTKQHLALARGFKVEAQEYWAHPWNVSMLASLKEVPQWVIMRNGDCLHTQTPPPSHPSLHFTHRLLYHSQRNGLNPEKNSLFSSNLLATNIGHSGDSSTLTSHISGLGRSSSSSQWPASSSGNSIQLQTLDSFLSLSDYQASSTSASPHGSHRVQFWV